MSKLAGNLPQTFKSSHCLKKNSNVQERSQTGDNQQLLIFPSGTSVETVRNSETDASHVKTITVLQSAPPGTNTNETNPQSMERVLREVVNLKGFVGCSGGMDVDVYCEDKLRSLSEGEIQTLVEVSEESIAEVLCGPIVSEKLVDESIRVDFVGKLEEGGQEYLSSRLVNSASGVKNVADIWKFLSESPLKRSAGVPSLLVERKNLIVKWFGLEKDKRGHMMMTAVEW